RCAHVATSCQPHIHVERWRTLHGPSRTTGEPCLTPIRSCVMLLAYRVRPLILEPLLVPATSAGGCDVMIWQLGFPIARLALISTVSLVVSSCDKGVDDEATRAGLTEKNFPQADEDYFHDMDNGIPLSADEVQGRNMWLVWTGGNDRFWDWM